MGKKYVDSAKLIDKSKIYDPSEALDLVCQTSKAKFDETIEIHIRLGVDSRHADQQVRGAVVLPNGTGKKVKVLVFAKGDNIEKAQAAGADYVGGPELAEKIQKENWFDFDVVIASPDMMGTIGRLGKVLGPKGLMPSPKAGTVTPDVAKAVREAKAGKIESGSAKPNKTKVAKLTKEQVRKIAEIKMPDLNASCVETAMSMVAGTARSMGVVVED